MKQVFLFIICLLGSILVQSFIWHVHGVADEKVWTNRAAQLAADLRILPAAPKIEHYSGHPGMTVLVLAAPLQYAGLSPNKSFLWSMAGINGLAAAGIFWFARQLQPASPWWLAAGVITLTHPLHLRATPTNSVIAMLTVLAFLLTWHVYQQPRTPASWHRLVALGSVLGAGLATRFTFAALLCAALGFFLAPRLQPRQILLGAATVLAVFVFLDPLTWSMPAEHVIHMLDRANAHFSVMGGAPIRYTDFVMSAPFGLLSIALFLALALPRFKDMQPLPLPLGFFLLIFTILISGVYLQASGQSLRYFFPLIFVWEALLPLFLFMLASQIVFSAALPYRHTLQRLFPAGLTLSVAAAEVFLLIYSLFTPTLAEFID